MKAKMALPGTIAAASDTIVISAGTYYERDVNDNENRYKSLLETGSGS